MAEIMLHWLDQRAGLMPDATAIEFSNGSVLDFKTLRFKSRQFAKQLVQLGLKKDDKVAILSTNHIDMVISTFALTYIGAIAVMLNVRLTSSELNYQLGLSDAKLLLTNDKLKDEKQVDFSNIYTFTEVSTKEIKINPELRKEINLDQPFTMMFTSGTTGRPKAVLHTYGNHWWNAIASSLNLGLEAQDKWLLTLPLFHIGGFSILVKSVIYGMPVYFLEKYDKTEMIKAFEEKSVTIASIVTVMLKDIMENYADKNLPEHVRCLLLGGSAVAEVLLEKVNQLHLPLYQSYGMTETTSQIVTINRNDYKRKIGSSGKPLFPAQLKIDGPDHEGIGEILVKGPTVFKGYYKRDMGLDFKAGWFKTGDLGYIDSEGFLYVVDRRKDLIISGGENIYPSEVEEVILSIEGVKEVAVVGKVDEKWGQVPIAYIVSNGYMKAEDIIHVTQEKLATFKNPKEIIFLDKLPRTASNKVKRHALSKQAKF